jgi:uncharacterized damage-inducible protein DinB
MTPVAVAVTSVVFVLGLTTVAGAQERGGGRGRGGAPPCTTLACDIQQDWARTQQQIVQIADAMPEDKWGFKPTPAQRSYGEQVMHIVQTDLALLTTLGASTPAPNINKGATSKADVMAALRQSFEYGSAVAKEFGTDQQWLERIKSMPFLGPTTSRARVINFSMSHSQDIYGQMAVYLRLNGIVPPASQRP